MTAHAHGNGAGRHWFLAPWEWDDEEYGWSDYQWDEEAYDFRPMEVAVPGIDVAAAWFEPGWRWRAN